MEWNLKNVKNAILFSGDLKEPSQSRGHRELVHKMER